MTPAQLAVQFDVPLIDYRRPGDGILIASGCGIMMSIMDLVPRLRWCVDADLMRALPPWRIEWFMTALDRNTEIPLLAVAGWFSLDSPRYLRAGLDAVTRMQVRSYSGGAGAFRGEAPTLARFLRALLDAPDAELAPHGDGFRERSGIGELEMPHQRVRVRPRVVQVAPAVDKVDNGHQRPCNERR
jgi:hypothetical protein